MQQRRDFLKALAAGVLAAGLPLPVGVAKPVEWVGEMKISHAETWLLRVMFVDDEALVAAVAEGSELAKDAVVGQWIHLPPDGRVAA